jgi:hypothetical protein
MKIHCRVGGGAAPAPPHAAWGASSIRVPKKNVRCLGLWVRCPKAWAGWLRYVHCSRSREGQEEKSRCFATVHKPCRMRKKKPIAVRARDQVVIGNRKAIGAARRPVFIFRVESTVMVFIACCRITCTIQSNFLEKTPKYRSCR